MQPLPFREIFRFYLPLVLTSQMMTLSGPVINIAVGRSADPKLEFAAYWLGFAVHLFVEAPCLIIQQAAATLLSGHRSMRRLFFGALLFGLLGSALSLALATTPLGDWFFRNVVPTTPRAAELARKVLLVMSPIPILVSMRGMGNALALVARETPLIARATVSRMVVIACLVGIAVAVGTSSGAIAGAASLATGLLVETLLVLHGTRKIRRGLRERRGGPDDVPLHYREILRVAGPLIVSSYAWTSVRPLINSILGRLPDPELAQGGFGVVIPLLLVTCSPLWALQNVTLILPGSRADLRRVVRFSAWVTVFFAGLIAMIVWTPLRGALLRGAFSLSPEMEEVVAPAMLLIVLEPIFLATRSASQGLLIKARRTGIFAAVSLAKIALMAAVGLALVDRFPTLNGAMLGIGLFISGELFDGLFYSLRARSLLLGGVLFPKMAAGEGETRQG
ncbi:MAG: hypothetical protein FJY73_09360 [Candidatus Eisenbacteria bacterium]|nr:hypothetical protein [Candidatus Eisenbacteria bacterium]